MDATLVLPDPKEYLEHPNADLALQIIIQMQPRITHVCLVPTMLLVNQAQQSVLHVQTIHSSNPHIPVSHVQGGKLLQVAPEITAICALLGLRESLERVNVDFVQKTFIQIRLHRAYVARVFQIVLPRPRVLLLVLRARQELMPTKQPVLANCAFLVRMHPRPDRLSVVSALQVLIRQILDPHLVLRVRRTLTQQLKH
jgi:hypothetical protein